MVADAPRPGWRAAEEGGGVFVGAEYEHRHSRVKARLAAVAPRLGRGATKEGCCDASSTAGLERRGQHRAEASVATWLFYLPGSAIR